MDLKVTNNIDNNIFSTTITVDAFGTEQLSELEERELISNFMPKLAYRNLKFKKNIKIDGIVPVITDTEPETIDGVSNGVVTISLPALSNKEILLDENFESHYKADCTKISPSVLDGSVITTKEIAAQSFCLIFSTVICDAVREIMTELRKKAPAFEGEQIISV